MVFIWTMYCLFFSCSYKNNELLFWYAPASLSVFFLGRFQRRGADAFFCGGSFAGFSLIFTFLPLTLKHLNQTFLPIFNSAYVFFDLHYYRFETVFFDSLINSSNFINTYFCFTIVLYCRDRNLQSLIYYKLYLINFLVN